MRNLTAAIAIALLTTACAAVPQAAPPSGLTQAEEAREAATITAMLPAQDAAWNRGDIDGFMAGYWMSPDLRFASGGNVTRGWQATVERYRTTYDSPAKMGTLVTGDYEIVLLSPDAAIAHGSWLLVREGDKPSGLYTLVLRKIDGDWLIVSDTTTSAN